MDRLMDDLVKSYGDSPLDLHNFKTSDATSLVEEFVWVCHQEGKSHGTIIHGKGTGALRDIVHQCLQENSRVQSFKLGSSLNPENWGQTTFQLKPMTK